MLVGRLALGQEKLVQSAFTFEWNCSRLAYDINVSHINLLKNTALHEDDISFLLKIIEVGQAGRKNLPLSRIDKFHGLMLKILQPISALWLLCGAAGFAANPTVVLERLTHNYFSAAMIASLPFYAYVVLISFFGSMYATTLYNYFVKWSKHIYKIPFPTKIYPKTFAFFTLLGVYMAAFSYAAGTKLIDDNIPAKPIWDIFRNIFLGCAESSLSFLGVGVVMDFINSLFSRITVFHGSDQAKYITRFNEKLNQMKESILLLDNEKFVESLKNLSEDNLQTMLGTSSEELEKKTDYGLDLSVTTDPMDEDEGDEEDGLQEMLDIPQKESWRDWLQRCCCFGSRNQRNRERYLTAQSDESDDSIRPLIRTNS